MRRVVAVAIQASVFVSLCVFFLWRYSQDGKPLSPVFIEPPQPTSTHGFGSTSATWTRTPLSSEAKTQVTESKPSTPTSTSELNGAAQENDTPENVGQITGDKDGAMDATSAQSSSPGSTEAPQYSDSAAIHNETMYVEAIMDPENNSFPRLSCPAPVHGRYDYLKMPRSTQSKPTYFFALDLHQCAPLLPRLLGSVIETIRFLGPESCVLSIVEGRSTEGTYEILNKLRQELAINGIAYFLDTSDADPKAAGVDRISLLAGLRNQALLPLTRVPEHYDPDTTVVFINDVSLCMEDILEVIHQRLFQGAHMTCAMDWVFSGWSFYDVWVSRTMNGHLFFEIPQDGSWDFANNLFWDDPATKSRQDAGRPYQVFSCWNGLTAFTAQPLLSGNITFRSHYENECFLGEPTIFCKDMWHQGLGRIAVVPSINLGYDDEESEKIKVAHGSVSDWLLRDDNTAVPEKVEWRSQPPDLIKCVPSWGSPSWVRWDEGLKVK